MNQNRGETGPAPDPSASSSLTPFSVVQLFSTCTPRESAHRRQGHDMVEDDYTPSRVLHIESRRFERVQTHPSQALKAGRHSFTSPCMWDCMIQGDDVVNICMVTPQTRELPLIDAQGV